MKILHWFAAVTSLAMVSGQAVFQQSTYPLSGFLQPLTLHAVPSSYQPQQQAVQQTATHQQLIAQQQPLYQAQAIQQQQQQPIQQQQATSSNVQEATYTTYQQQQQPTSSANSGTATGQQQQPATYAGPSAVVNNVNADGTYSFGYQTPDGQMRAEAVQADGTTRGSYTYRTPEGQLVTINYTAGKHGFQTSPGTSITSADTSAATATANAPATSSNPTLVPVSGTTSGGTPIVIYSTVPQAGFQSYYPFTGVVAQQETTAAEQQPVVATSVQQRSNQEQQGQTSSAVAAAPSTNLRAPVGFSYGSNPQAIQQLQRLLLV